MIPVVNTSLSSMPPQATAMVGQAVPTEATLGSLPSRSVYGAIAAPALNNQRGSQAGVPSPLAQTAPQTTGQSTLFNLNALSRPGGAPDFSSAFFTQLLAQSSAETQAGITQNFAFNPIRLSDPETIASFAGVKYLPSNAFKPAPEPVRGNLMPLPATPEPQVRIQQLQQQQQSTAQAQVQQPAAAPQLQREASVVTVVMRHSFSYAPISRSAGGASRDSSSVAEETLRCPDRQIAPKEAAGAYAQAASRLATTKPVEAVAKGNTD